MSKNLDLKVKNLESFARQIKEKLGCDSIQIVATTYDESKEESHVIQAGKGSIYLRERAAQLWLNGRNDWNFGYDAKKGADQADEESEE